MAKTDDAPQLTERVVLRKETGGWNPIGTTKTRTPDEAIDLLTKTPDGDGNVEGEYRTVPSRYWGDVVEIKVETKVVSSFITKAEAGETGPTPTPTPEPPVEDDEADAAG